MLLAMAMVAGREMHAENGAGVVVYLENGVVIPQQQYLATRLADGLFAAAGVRIAWRHGVPATQVLAEERAISVRFGVNTLPSDHPGALAFALPYDGTRVRVFYDRIQQNYPEHTEVVLAHVLAHELGHILQGIARHSKYGIMKANWDCYDYKAMLRRKMSFAPADVDLLQIGVAHRGAALNR